MDVSEKILELRKSAGYSQERLAELLHVSRQAVSKWEAGAAVPTLDNLIELSKLFQAPLDALTGTGQGKPPEMAKEKAAEEERDSNEGQTRQAQASRELARARRQRNASFALAGVLLSVLVISVLSNAARSAELTTQMSMLSGRVSALESRSYSVPQSAQQPVTGWQAQNSLIADFSYEVERYDPKTGLLSLSISATPKVYVEGMTALFSATAKGMDAIETQGTPGAGKAFTCSITIPAVEELRLSIAFAQDGETHTQLLDTITGLEKFQMQVDSVFNGGVQRIGETIMLKGEVETRIRPVDFAPGSHETVAGEPWNRPVSGTVELIVNGTVAATEQMPIDDIYNAADGQAIPIGETTFYTRFLDEISVPTGSELSLLVTVLDNFGIEHTQEIPISE